MNTVYTVISPVLSASRGNNPGKMFYLPQDVLEWSGRICYDSTRRFRDNLDYLYSKIVTSRHLDVLEHAYFGMEFDVPEEYNVNDLYYFNYIFKKKFPYMSIDIKPVDRKVGIYGNIRTWYENSVDDYSHLWGFVSRTDMQELILSLSVLVPNVFHCPQWLDSQKDTIGRQIQHAYADKAAHTSGYKVYTTPEGVDVMMLARTPKSNFTDEFHVTFQINHGSRAMTHQLVRHRLLSFSQRSQRYVDESSFSVLRPKCNTEQMAILNSHFNDVRDIYSKLRKAGMRKEDARCVLPNATETEIVVSGTSAGWKHFIKLRCADDAQTEIRNIAFAMKDMMEAEYGSSIF